MANAMRMWVAARIEIEGDLKMSRAIFLSVRDCKSWSSVFSEDNAQKKAKDEGRLSTPTEREPKQIRQKQ